MTQNLSERQATIDDLCINTMRTLAIDAIEAAKSGHPGAPMGLAPAAYVLWTRILKHNPQNPGWVDRDRFVLSGGHASMMLYSLLYLCGYDVSLDDIKNFRQWESRTPGHPEYGHTPGVETTTGPLGQGFANALGMAMAERCLAVRFNRKEQEIVNHYTFVMCGDGDLMEGVASEAASLAGHLGLAKLIAVYDDNQITIEGDTDITFTEDVESRFKAYRWHVQRVEDGNDITAIQNALEAAKKEAEKPSLIILRTHIAYGSPNKQDSCAAHGAPLGEEEVRLTKECLGCPIDEVFCVPDQVLEAFRNCVISGQVLNAVAEKIPTLIGGSADLAPSNNTIIKSSHDFHNDTFSRQKLPVFNADQSGLAKMLSNGAYVLADAEGKPDIILVASGSEVQVCLQAKGRLAEKGISARVVSMPSWELFEATSPDYQETVLPSDVTHRLAVEAGISMGWERYVGNSENIIGIDRFGASAPGGTVMEKFGISVENIVKRVVLALKK